MPKPKQRTKEKKVYLTPEELQELNDAALRLGINANDFIRVAIKEKIKKKKKLF